MSRTLAVVLLLLSLAATVHADQPGWAFEGVLPAIFQMRVPVPASVYAGEGHVLTREQIAASMEIELGDPLVLIRDGEVLGEGTVGEVVAKTRQDALDGRLIFLRPAGLPADVEVPVEPAGPSALLDAGYDLYVLTDQPVEVLAPDPRFADVPWGAHDYCVRVGRLRFAVIREYWPRTETCRGWQVVKLAEDEKPYKVHFDNTFQTGQR